MRTDKFLFWHGMKNLDKKPRILVVDDRPENLLAMSKLLKPLAAEIITADSGEQALAQVLRHRFAVILLDVQMPNMDGFEAARLIRANKSTSTVPIIFVTAISKEEHHVHEGYESGAVDYLYKPVNADILLSKVKVFLQIEEQRLEMEALTENLRSLNEKNSLLLEGAGEGIVGVDLEGNIEFINQAALTLFEAEDQNLQGRSLLPMICEPGIQQEIEIWKKDRNSMGVSERTARIRGQQNSEKPIEFNLAPVHDPKGNITGGVLVFRDITERLQLEEHLTHLAKYDSLTGLANRTLFLEFLNNSLQRSERRQRSTAVLFLDLDHFKQINDTLGHDVGDDLLVSVAERLHDCVREGDLIARLGGDEFAVVLDDIGRADDVPLIAEKIVTSISRPHILAGRELHVSTSVGAATWPECGQDSTQLIKAADTAMYVTKKAGRKGYRCFTPDMEAEGQRRAALEQALKSAVRHGGFELIYQPMVNLITGRVGGYEAMLRWPHDGRLWEPDEFVPMVESLRLMNPMGCWMIENVCREMQNWCGSDKQRQDISFAINLSLSQCRDEEIQKRIEQAIERYGFEPDQLELEVSERIVSNIPGKLITALSSLREQGVHITLDNFGSGASALSYLRKLPVDIVKVDQLYIREIGKDRQVEGILKAMTGLAHNMGIRAVAEGVNSPEQLAFIRELEYDRAQGMLLGRPEAITRIEYEGQIMPSIVPKTRHSSDPRLS